MTRGRGGRRLLAAPVAGPAAFFIARDAGRLIEQQAREYLAHPQMRGFGEAILEALRDIEEAGKQWREDWDAGSAGGTSEVPQRRSRASSDLSSSTNWLTVSEVAGRVDVSEGYVRRMCRSGAVRRRRVGGSWQIDEASVAKWERDRSRKGA